MIVAISGLLEDSQGRKRIAGAGKDEAAKALVDAGFVSVAFADEMKRFCKELYGFTDEQLWGASEERAKEDKRYPRRKKISMVAYEDAECLAALEFAASGKVMTEEEKEREYLTEYLTVRYALQKLGDWGRDCFADIWANKALEIAHKLLKKPHDCRYTPQEGLSYENISYNGIPLINERNGVVIPDCRFQNEFRRVKEEGGKIIRVKRKCDEFPSVLDDGHISERDILVWDDDKFDYVIENDGTPDLLRLKVEHVLSEVSGRLIPYDDEQKDIPPFKRKRK